MSDSGRNVLIVIFIYLVLLGAGIFLYQMKTRADLNIDNVKYDDYVENLLTNNLTKPTNKSIETVAVVIKKNDIAGLTVVVDKIKNEFCNYKNDSVVCYPLTEFNNFFENKNFLNYTNHVIMFDYTINPMTAFIINDNLKQEPEIIIKNE